MQQHRQSLSGAHHVAPAFWQHGQVMTLRWPDPCWFPGPWGGGLSLTTCLSTRASPPTSHYPQHNGHPAPGSCEIQQLRLFVTGAPRVPPLPSAGPARPGQGPISTARSLVAMCVIYTCCIDPLLSLPFSLPSPSPHQLCLLTYALRHLQQRLRQQPAAMAMASHACHNRALVPNCS